MRIIDVLVSPQGETTVQTSGFMGSSCQDASRFIEQALGRKSNEKLTAEFHTTEEQCQQLREVQ